MYTFEQLKEDVRKEAEALRVHATKEERARLNLEDMRPTNISSCYYGLMTGNCYSQRAAELIHSCCISYFKNEIMPYLFEAYSTIDNIQKGVNGAVVYGFVKERTGMSSASHFSAIEAYILLPEAN